MIHVRCISNSSKVCTDRSTVHDDDENNDSAFESQDEDDMGHGVRVGGGFTSTVSIWPMGNINIQV
jgi:hypothetical protein